MVKTYTPEMFKKLFPAVWKGFPKHVRSELLADKRYIIKVGEIDGEYAVEFGYREDNWTLK